MKRLLICWLGGALIGFAAAECIILPLAFFTPIPAEAMAVIGFLLGFIGGTAGSLFTINRWGDA